MAVAVNQKARINVLRFAGLATLALILFTTPGLGVSDFNHEMIEFVGVLLLLVGVLGRFWSILYVGGVKNQLVMRDGPYSMTRNPLYFFSTIAATGIGLMFGAVTYALVLGGTVGLVLWITAKLEARFLSEQFGRDYDDYAAQTPFFFPDPRLFHSRPAITFDTGALRRNLFDAFVFLSFIPLSELLDEVKQALDWSLFMVW